MKSRITQQTVQAVALLKYSFHLASMMLVVLGLYTKIVQAASVRMILSHHRR